MDFCFELSDAYHFKHTIAVIKEDTEETCFIFTPLGFEISSLSQNRSIIHKITIRAADIPYFQYNIRDSNGNLAPEYAYGFKTDKMLNVLKNLGVKDGVCFFKREDEDHITVVHKKNQVATSSSMGLYVPIIQYESKRFDLPPGYPEEPQVLCDKKEFRDICKQLLTNNAASMDLRVIDNTFQIFGVLSTNAPLGRTIVPFVNHSIPPRVEGAVKIKVLPWLHVIIPNQSIKTLSKIHNVASREDNLIKFFFVRNAPIRMILSIGNYGEYCIGLRSGETK